MRGIFSRNLEKPNYSIMDHKAVLDYLKTLGVNENVNSSSLSCKLIGRCNRFLSKIVAIHKESFGFSEEFPFIFQVSENGNGQDSRPTVK